MYDHPHPRLQGLLGVVLILGLGSIVRAEDRGGCITANVAEDFTLPDRSVRHAGRIVLCTIEAFTPAIDIHRILVGNEGATFLMTHRVESEVSAGSPPVLVFRRVPGEPLDLLGFVVSRGRHSGSYKLLRPAPKPEGATAHPSTSTPGRGDAP